MWVACPNLAGIAPTHHAPRLTARIMRNGTGDGDGLPDWAEGACPDPQKLDA